jgi:hypothetical protein
MKPAHTSGPIAVDRLATWNEVFFAMSISSQDAFTLVGSCDELQEMDSDFSGNACNVLEDDLWLGIVSKMSDSKSN